MSRTQQLMQIEHSREAATQALCRRGLTEKYRLEVQLYPRVVLRKKGEKKASAKPVAQ